MLSGAGTKWAKMGVGLFFLDCCSLLFLLFLISFMSAIPKYQSLVAATLSPPLFWHSFLFYQAQIHRDISYKQIRIIIERCRVCTLDKKITPGYHSVPCALLKRLVRGWSVIAFLRSPTGGLLTNLASVDCTKTKRRIYFKLPFTRNKDRHTYRLKSADRAS